MSEYFVFKGLFLFCFVTELFVSVMKPLSEETGAEDSTAAVGTRSQGG